MVISSKTNILISKLSLLAVLEIKSYPGNEALTNIVKNIYFVGKKKVIWVRKKIAYQVRWRLIDSCQVLQKKLCALSFASPWLPSDDNCLK